MIGRVDPAIEIDDLIVVATIRHVQIVHISGQPRSEANRELALEVADLRELQNRMVSAEARKGLSVR